MLAFILFSFLTLIKADSIDFLSPNIGEVVTYPINVHFEIEKSGILTINEIKFELLDNEKNILITTITDVSENSDINFQIESNELTTSYTNTNFYVKFTGNFTNNLEQEDTNIEIHYHYPIVIYSGINQKNCPELTFTNLSIDETEITEITTTETETEIEITTTETEITTTETEITTTEINRITSILANGVTKTTTSTLILSLIFILFM